MPLITLPNFKTVEVPIEVFLFSDKEYDLYIQELMSLDAGEEIEDFSYNSSFNDAHKQTLDENEDFEDLTFRDDI